MRPIGYYVHHQGIGHWQRARAIAPLLRRPCTLIGTIGAETRGPYRGPVLDLPDDKLPLPPQARPAARPEAAALHYAPPSADGLRRRSLLLVEWIAAHRPALMVVDVSVEVALLARLCATPVAFFRLAGRRDDAPHLAAFEASEALIAPFPASLDDPEVPDWVRERSFYAGLLTRLKAPHAVTVPGRIVVVIGRGGAVVDAATLVAAARAMPGMQWQVLGLPVPDEALPDNLDWPGWVEDPTPFLATAEIVVGGGGDGLLAEVAALGKRFVCIPEERPFGEQRVKAERLAAMGAAIALPDWPETAVWPDIVRQALALAPAAMAGLHDPSALGAVARFIDATADEAERSYPEMS